MGTAIGVLWLASVGIFVSLSRQRFADRGFGWALRLGMLITVIGSATGGLMVSPTDGQRLTIANTHQAPRTIGGHTVGAPDGGPGLPGLGWSSHHGDLRIPHFLGLHALQVIPLLYLLRMRRRPSPFVLTGTSYAFAIAASYFALVGIATWQALRGRSPVELDSASEFAIAMWFLVTGIAYLVPRLKLNSYGANAAGVL